MRRLTLGTAGHIDHGKTALVRALTGVDTDRLPEEKRRGITIDLGFASLALGDIELGIVDVPGHEAFVRNMLAGATGIDLALLVIAADEGVMPQTREHLAILQLLGIRRAVVALTKADLADSDWLDLVREDTAALLAGTALADAPVLAVSALTGDGMTELKAALDAAARSAPDRATDDLFRMPIDRIFTVRGTGTVVTGTVWSGSLRRDQQVRIEPAGAVARIRGLQRHGADTDEIRAGERAAVALTGIDRDDLGRGDALLSAAAWRPASILTVRIAAVADAELMPRQRVRVHLGTAEVLARLALSAPSVRPGQDALGQLRLEAPLVARTGDRLVIRSYSPVHTIGGGTVLEPDAPKRKRWPVPLQQQLSDLAEPATALPALLGLAGPDGVRRSDLAVLLPYGAPVPGADPATAAASAPAAATPPAGADASVAADAEVVSVGDRVVLRQCVADRRDAILERLGAFHRQHPLDAGMEKEALRRHVEAAAGGGLFDHALQQLLADGTVVGRAGLLALPGHRPTPTSQQREQLRRLAELYAGAGLQPPETGELPADLATDPGLLTLLRHLEGQGILRRIAAARWADADAVVRGVSALCAQLPVSQPLTVAQLKEVLVVSRKHLIPLLEYFDAVGVTTRSGETRILNSDAEALVAAQPLRGDASVERADGGTTKS